MADLRSGHSSYMERIPQARYQKTVLPNGLRVVTEEIPYVRSISIGVWIDVGSRDETRENNGISHFVEHMVFKGTERFSCPKIARSLEQYGGYLNAFTTKEHTCFYARILDDHLKDAVDVLSDLVQRPVFSGKEMEKEKQVILEELKNIEDDPDDLIHEYFDHNVFRKHPLGFSIIGRAETIKRIQREDLLAYVRSHYVPSQIVVSAAGHLRHEELVALVERYFGRMRAVKRSHVRSLGPHNLSPKEETFERPITQAHVCLGTIGYSAKHRARFPFLVLNTILGEGMSSRLFQNIREKYGFAYAIYSFANLMSDTGNFGVYVATDNSNIDHSIELIYRELDKLKTRRISAAELRRTKAQLKGSMMLSLESMSSRMMRLGSSEFYFGRLIPLDEVIASINGVTSDHIQDVAHHLFRFENFSTVIFKPAVRPDKAVSQAA